VPSAMAGLLRLGGVPVSVRTVGLGGEPLPGALARQVHERCGCRVLNLYGPTEDTTYSTWEDVPASLAGEPSIGRVLDGGRAYVLDRWLNPVPEGVSGEVFLGGAGLARGYLGRPGLTAERFVPDPFGRSGSRLYRTGDLARQAPDGRLEYLGRIDQQVKVRGFRVETGEIEASLAQHPAVREAVVKAHQEEEGERYLVAYLIPEGEAVPGAAELRAFLEARLPAYLVPSFFVTLAALPLTPNGKVDRRALEPPGELRSSASRPAGVAPRSLLEQAVADAWTRVLRLDRVGVFENFFELGGHSLTAVQVVSQLREDLGVEVPLRSLFKTATVAEMAVAILRQMAEESGEDALDETGDPTPQNPENVSGGLS
jgi:acyl carrier protein